MSPRLAVVLGLLAGVATAVIVMGAILALAPGPVHPTPTPFASVSPVESSSPPILASPSAGASPSVQPLVSASSSAAPAPSGSGPTATP